MTKNKPRSKLTKKQLADRKRAIKALGIMEFMKLTSLTRGTVGGILYGTRDPSFDEAIRMSNLSGIDRAILLPNRFGI
mgnify:CR=1 FL=1|tara:strand:+ start:7354 stop:7587 length:234 start_codon:yes stop_codon:yes gene_type:complete